MLKVLDMKYGAYFVKVLVCSEIDQDNEIVCMWLKIIYSKSLKTFFNITIELPLNHLDFEYLLLPSLNHEIFFLLLTSTRKIKTEAVIEIISTFTGWK